MRVENSQRAKRHIVMLKERGRYEDYKKKKAEGAKERRMKAKQNEMYLPPELQLHLMNERRRATRERVKRWRDRKSQNGQIEKMESQDLDSKVHDTDFLEVIPEETNIEISEMLVLNMFS